jgi:hypothetical protein
MTTKSKLIAEMLREIRKAQTEKWQRPKSGPVKQISFPPILWPGDGRSFRATDGLLKAIAAYTRICWDNDPTLRPRFKVDELEQLVHQAVATALGETDLDLSDQQLHPALSDRVTAVLAEKVEQSIRPLDLTVGCHLIEGDEPYPIQIGPVRFDTREAWRQRMLEAGKLSATTARRLLARWNGEPLKKRKSSFDSAAEESISDAIGDCPVVCSVATEGLSGKYVQQKGLLAARLAITAISLSWYQPSEGLRWMKLLYDRRRDHRHTVLFGSGTNVGSNAERSEIPYGRYSEPELLENIRSYQWLFDQVGEALFAYVQPVRAVTRPKVMNALFLSLWWYHEACREAQDQIATTKFAASMDALASRKKAGGIIALIGARLGHEPDDPLMTDGRTTKALVAQIYDAGRSRLIHGSSDDFAHDWTQLRGSAEAIGRWLLILSCEWFSDHPNTDEIQ